MHIYTYGNNNSALYKTQSNQLFYKCNMALLWISHYGIF